MGGGFEDNLLDDQIRRAIHEFALEARRILMDEARDLLEGVYGVHSNGDFDPPENLPALVIPKNREIYERLIRFLDDEVQAGLARPKAVEKLRKEIAFTHLNRLVAFKMMEKRKLIREAVGRGTKSNGFLFYLADHPEDQSLWQAGQAEIAYQHFLLWQAGQIAQEIKVLFDQDSLPSRLFPRAQPIQTILDLINAQEIAPAWDTVEALGWVYQYFNEPELQAAFSAVSTGAKFEAEDIPSVTQLFTIRWIVRYLVENTLGRFWLEMHPDSDLKGKLRYLVPNPNEKQVTGEYVEIKPVKDITLLDPACGTMHFGVLAFDLFSEMYREEIKRAGEPGWPETPSVEEEDEIPAAILANNLYGIDIDLRAVQLAALALYLKVKGLNKETRITRHNLVCADVLTLNGKRLGVFLKEAQFSRPIYERLIRALWEKLENINQLGSLLRLEQEVETLIADERTRYEREGRQSDMFVDRSAEFESAAAKEEYWTILGGQIIQAIDHFAKSQAEAGTDQSFFAGEATKGIQVLDLMLRSYDIVATNPPYMYSRNMNVKLRRLVAENYKEGKGDLYAAFIIRCIELLKPDGRLGMLTMHSFMFISLYKNLRKYIRNNCAIENMAHQGPNLFATGNPGTLQTTAFILRREIDSFRRNNSTAIYFRLVNEENADAKQKAFERMIAGLRNANTPHGVYFLAQKEFNSIQKEPWAYWLPESIRKIFVDFQPLSDSTTRPFPCNTSDNFRFVRYSWEILRNRIGNGKRWIYYSKGGGYKKWFGNFFFIIDWSENARAFYREDKIGKITDEASWYQEVITYAATRTKGFYSRYFPPIGVYDRKGPAIKVNHPKAFVGILGLLNSKIVSWLLEILNPTISVQAGDIDRIPLPDISKIIQSKLTNYSQNCIYITIIADTQIETNANFICPTINTGRDALTTKFIQYEELLEEEVYRLYGINLNQQAAIEADLCGDFFNLDKDAQIISDDVEENENQLFQVDLCEQWISFAIGIVLGRFKPGVEGYFGCTLYGLEDFALGSLPAPDETEFNELVGLPGQFAYIDESEGRHVFSAEVEQALRDLALPDGIAVLDEGHPRDLPALVEIALVLMLGEAEARDVIREATGDSSSASLRKFLERDFFTKWHMRWYKKRPVYWPIQSPNRGYGFVIFHEKITKDTFFAIQRKPFLESKINAVTFHLEEIEDLLHSAQGAKLKSLEKQLDQTRKLADELAEFSQTLERITLGSDHLPGYTSEDNWIDDGVILRMAPLWELIPSWSSEPKKYWARLQNGDYDWSHTAMHYWSERCKEKCKTNKSFAFAHGLEHLYKEE